VSADLLYQAERDIALILANLEKHTGQHVGSIRVDSYESTQIKDVRPIHKRQVIVDLKPIPGSDWT
jgi:hypothetical protein